MSVRYRVGDSICLPEEPDIGTTLEDASGVVWVNVGPHGVDGGNWSNSVQDIGIFWAAVLADSPCVIISDNSARSDVEIVIEVGSSDGTASTTKE